MCLFSLGPTHAHEAGALIFPIYIGGNWGRKRKQAPCLAWLDHVAPDTSNHIRDRV